MSDWKRNLVTDDEGFRAILREAKRIAVIGAKGLKHEPAFYVPSYLAAHGYDVRGVNPVWAGRELFGHPVVETVADLPEPVDVIEVFRRPRYLEEHAAEILALPWRPKAVWFQLGIRSDAAAATLARAGLRVVQDRCMMPEHCRLIGAA